MPKPTISLCVIVGQEECHIERFLRSFSAAFDQLCVVRAIGNQPHDRTVSLAKDFCSKNGKDFKFAEYRNAGWSEALGYDAKVDDSNPATWKHVDDFASARNMSWKLSTSDWQFWADLDDVLEPGAPERIRNASHLNYDAFFFTYSIRTSLETNIRERLFRRGISHWSQPVHENCRFSINDPKIATDRDCIFSHEPVIHKPRDPDRNRRILEWHNRYIHAFAFEVHREYYYKWAFDGKDEHAKRATQWAEIAQAVDTLPEQRYDMFLNQAHIVSAHDLGHAIDLCRSAVWIAPMRRDAWGDMAEYELRDGKAARALMLAKIMSSFPKPQDSGFPISQKYYGWQGMLLITRCYRAAGQEDNARKIEDKHFEEGGRKISLLHATRGRPDQAIKTRNNFFAAAGAWKTIEHIFAIDADDKESLEKLSHYRHVVVKEPKGCVRAWNQAAKASTGDILVQLSDDWMPCVEWDALVINAFLQGAAAKGGSIAATPMVLAISDNHRRDQLLTMAILNRARYEQQGKEMFSDEYFGVFSDNEFTYRAYKDGVVLDAKHIVFDHNHPIWEGKPESEWDETHRRQNAPERYTEGEAVFKRRNPEVVK